MKEHRKRARIRSCAALPWGTAATFALLIAGEPRAQLVADPGFENSPIGTDFNTPVLFTPASLTTWGIDSAIVTAEENGITPFEGTQMVRANIGRGTDLYTLVDLSPFAAEIAAQVAVVDLSTYFNTTATNEASVSLRVFSGTFNFTFNDDFGQQTTAPLFSDADLGTWELVELTGYRIPAGAEYLAVGVHCVFNAAEPSYFDGVALAIRNVPQFVVTNVAAVPGNPAGSSIEITWTGQTGRLYGVERSLDSLTDWILVATNISGMALNTYTDGAPVEASVAYRARDEGSGP